MSQQINLFNPIFLKKEKHFSALTMVQALGLILIGCIVLVVYANRQLSHLEMEAQSTAAQLRQAQAQLNMLNTTLKVEDKTEQIEKEVVRAEAEVQGLRQAFEALRGGGFGNTEGYAEYMRAFARQIESGIWLTGFDIQGAGSDIGLQGRALKPELVPAYIGRLRRETVLQGKSFATLDMHVPAVEQGGQANPTDEKVSAPYIEFVLQSSAAKEQASLGEGGK